MQDARNTEAGMYRVYMKILTTKLRRRLTRGAMLSRKAAAVANTRATPRRKCPWGAPQTSSAAIFKAAYLFDDAPGQGIKRLALVAHFEIQPGFRVATAVADGGYHIA